MGGMSTILFWIVFHIVLLALLILDLVVFHKKVRKSGFREAVFWSIFWVGLALLFNWGIYLYQGTEPAIQFLTGYVLEKSLSVDNLFVFLLIFSYFSVPKAFQHKILFWGIIGALGMRALFIGLGVALIQQLHWVLYVFGAILIISGFKLFFEDKKEINPDKNWILRLFKRFVPITTDISSGRFFTCKNGRWLATPLLAVLLVVETTDIIFAVDSIPAVLAISRDPFIVYTSNVFAILGLRALYGVLSGVMGMFRFLHYGLGGVLMFVGFKMVVEPFLDVPILVSLGVIFAMISLSVAASLIYAKSHPPASS